MTPLQEFKQLIVDGTLPSYIKSFIEKLNDSDRKEAYKYLGLNSKGQRFTSKEQYPLK